MDVLKKVLLISWLVLKWIGPMLFSAILWVLAKILWPLAWITRDIPIFKNYIFWIFWDHEIENGKMPDDFKRWLVGKDWSKWWTKYIYYAWRNPAWNQYLLSFMKPRQGTKIRLYSRGYLEKYGVEQSVFDFAVLKYIDAFYNYIDNNSDGYLSDRHSIVGSMFCIYKIDGTRYFRYSYAKKPHPAFRILFEIIHHGFYIPINIVLLIVNLVRRFIKRRDIIPFYELTLSIDNWWIEFHAGANDKRYTFRIKFKKVKLLT